MINRKEFADELLLRKYIRTAIDTVIERRDRTLNEENELRSVIRDLILEADPAVVNSAVHSNTGINALEDLFKNTNLLTVLRQGYKSLTSTKEQRESYMSHILNAVEMSMRTADATDPDEEEDAAAQEMDELAEQDIKIDVGDRPEDHPAFIDVEEKEPTEEEDVEVFSIQGQDKTGRNRAYTDYKNVEKNLLTAYDNLDAPGDREMFRDYLLTNLKLYFERFEEELQADLPEPQIDLPPDVAEEPAPEGNMELDTEEMLEWLVLNAIKD